MLKKAVEETLRSLLWTRYADHCANSGGKHGGSAQPKRIVADPELADMCAEWNTDSFHSFVSEQFAAKDAEFLLRLKPRLRELNALRNREMHGGGVQSLRWEAVAPLLNACLGINQRGVLPALATMMCRQGRQTLLT